MGAGEDPVSVVSILTFLDFDTGHSDYGDDDHDGHERETQPKQSPTEDPFVHTPLKLALSITTP